MTSDLFYQVVDMILDGFQHSHPRVRWAAINAIGQLLSSNLGPELQTQYHQKLLPALADAMDDFQLNPRVQAHAASAILNFSENCTPEILTPYLDRIVSQLLVLLQNGKQMVRERSLTALASVADSSQEQFQKYYDAVMPHLKAILVNATDKSNRMLRAKSMECISLVGMAVGKYKFRDDAKQVMDVLMSLQGSQLENDDPITSYMIQALARLCKSLGQDFLPYMSVVMPPLLQSAQSTDSDELYDDSVEMITLGDKRIGIRTSVLEEKATACNMLCCYADELKEGFFPWIDQVAPTLVPLLKFYFHEEVRRAAVASMPQLLRSAKLAIEKGQAGGRDDYLKLLSEYIVPALVEALHKEPETEIAASMIDSLHECMQLSGALHGGRQFRAIVDGTKNVTTASATRKRERSERAKAGDFDADEWELLQEENELALIKKFAGHFREICLSLKKFTTDVNTEVAVVAIQAIGNLVFFGNHFQNLLPVLLEKFKDKNPTIRNALSQTLQDMHKSGCVLLTDVVEDVKVALKHEDPLVRSQTLNWVAFCMETSNQATVLELRKVYEPICMECLNDKTPEVRDASFSVFAAICKMLGMKTKRRLLKKLDEDGKKKLSEMIGIPESSAPGASNNEMPEKYWVVPVEIVRTDLMKKLWCPNSSEILYMDLGKLSRDQLKNLCVPNGVDYLENATKAQLKSKLRDLDKVVRLNHALSDELWLKANHGQITSLPQRQTRGMTKSLNSQSVVEQQKADWRQIFHNLQSRMEHVKEKQKKIELNRAFQKGYRDISTIQAAIKDKREQLIKTYRLLIEATEEEHAGILENVDEISIQLLEKKKSIENLERTISLLEERLKSLGEVNEKLNSEIHDLEKYGPSKQTKQKKKKQDGPEMSKQKKKKQDGPEMSTQMKKKRWV